MDALGRRFLHDHFRLALRRIQWRSALRAFGSLGKLFSRDNAQAPSEMDAIEVPISWFIAGQLVGLVGSGLDGERDLRHALWQSTVAVC